MNYFKTNLLLQQQHGFNIDTLEMMMPWERLVYIDLIGKKEKEEETSRNDLMNAQRDIKGFQEKLRRHGQ